MRFMTTPAPSPLEDVAVLYVDPRGPYPQLVREWYDEARDARTYAGPWPVVAHPPCGPWGRLSHLCTRQDSTHGPIAFELVRRWGGVLEQPAWSRMFAACAAPPGQLGRVSLPDRWGGVTIEVNQCDWGHVARKPTWLYLIGIREVGMLPERREPTHWVSGGRSATRKGYGGRRPAHILACSAEQRRRTPIDFARWLVDLAAQASPRASKSPPRTSTR